MSRFNPTHCLLESRALLACDGRRPDRLLASSSAIASAMLGNRRSSVKRDTPRISVGAICCSAPTFASFPMKPFGQSLNQDRTACISVMVTNALPANL